MGIANLARYGALATIPKVAGGGRFANILNFLKPAAGWVGSHPMQTGAALGGTYGLATEGLGGVPGGATLGALGGIGMGGIGGAGGVANAGRLLGRIPGVNAATAAAGAPILASGAQIAATGALGGLYGPLARGGQDRVGGIAASQLTGRGDPNSGDVLGSGNLPPGTIDRMMGPQGNYWYRLDPAGVPAGDRLNRQLDARTNANVMNILGDTGFAQTERLQKADLARQAAAKQLKENIEMARTMSQNSQTSGLNMAENMNRAVATAMQNRNNFNYFS